MDGTILQSRSIDKIRYQQVQKLDSRTFKVHQLMLRLRIPCRKSARLKLASCEARLVSSSVSW